MEHRLKTWPAYFEAVRSGRKTFEVRRNDCGFAVGDLVHLDECSIDGGETGRSVTHAVTYIGRPNNLIPLADGYVILGLGSP